LESEAWARKITVAMPPVADAGKLLNETFARLLHALSVVSNFRKTLLAVSPQADKHLNSTLTELLRDLFEAPEWAGFLVPIDPAAPMPKTKPDYAAIAKPGADAMLATTYAQVDAATLIFYHSILDGVAFDCLRVTALQAPADWEKDLERVKVGLLEIRGQAYDELLRAQIDKRLTALERESLLTKIDRLYARCKPAPTWSPMDGYDYDPKRIREFDAQRHEIIHGAPIGKPLTLFPVTNESLWYLFRSGMFFISLVLHRYGLQVDSRLWTQAATQRIGWETGLC
jgi:hypothetical protein